MKAFKQQLNQPEAWLREVLEGIATLHKSGPFANHWELSEVYRSMTTADIAQSGTAPGDMGGDDSEMDGDDDDENIQMEDVPAIS